MKRSWRSPAAREGRGVRLGLAPPALCSILLAATLLAPSGGCSRDESGVSLKAAFNAQTEIGRVTAVWELTGNDRSFADGVRLKEQQVEARYRVDAENELEEKIFLRLRDFRLVDQAGLLVASAADQSAECTLGHGRIEGVLRGTLWLPSSAAEGLEGFRVDPFAVPLSDRGQALYREWLLQGRPNRTTEVNAEIADLAAAPACAGVPD